MAVRRAQRGQPPEGPGALCQPSATLGLYCVATLGQPCHCWTTAHSGGRAVITLQGLRTSEILKN